MIEFELTKKDFKEYLKNKRSVTNIIFLIIGTIIYFYITFYLLFTNPFETFIFYLIYIVGLIIIILLFNELYCIINIKKNKNILGNYQVNIIKDKIIAKINNNTYEYLNSNIKQIKNNKKYIIIKFNNHTTLLFIKSLLHEKDYDILNKIM